MRKACSTRFLSSCSQSYGGFRNSSPNAPLAMDVWKASAGSTWSSRCGRLLGALLVEFDGVGLDRRRAALAEQVGQPSERVARAAAGIERPDARLRSLVVAVGLPHEAADQVDDPVRRGIVPALGLCRKSHVNLPS